MKSHNNNSSKSRKSGGEVVAPSLSGRRQGVEVGRVKVACDKSKSVNVANSSKRLNVATNSREREKTQSVNTAFGSLRNLIPTEPIDRKLSKIETLRLASSYITHLSQHVLNNESDDSYNFGSDFEETSNNPTFVANANPSKICTFCLADTKKSKHSNLRTSATVRDSGSTRSVPTSRDFHSDSDVCYETPPEPFDSSSYIGNQFGQFQIPAHLDRPNMSEPCRLPSRNSGHQMLSSGTMSQILEMDMGCGGLVYY